MIFDRTQNDVDTAILLRNTKVKKFETLTESDIATLEKGRLTINTLNRIETKQEELKNLFNDMGYWNTPTTNKLWSENDIFNIDELIISQPIVNENPYGALGDDSEEEDTSVCTKESSYK